jgi:hypothetical protein
MLNFGADMMDNGANLCAFDPRQRQKLATADRRRLKCTALFVAVLGWKLAELHR